MLLVDVPEEELVRRALRARRADDQEEVVRERLRVYREKTEPLIGYYRGRGLLREIDGNRPDRGGDVPDARSRSGAGRLMVLKTPGEIELMDQANRIVHQVLDGVGEKIAPGVTPRELDRLAERVIRGAGGVPAFLHYRGYPATLCISVNDVIVHGIPNDVPLREGRHRRDRLRRPLQGVLRRRGAHVRGRRGRARGRAAARR